MSGYNQTYAIMMCMMWQRECTDALEELRKPTEFPVNFYPRPITTIYDHELEKK